MYLILCDGLIWKQCAYRGMLFTQVFTVSESNVIIEQRELCEILYSDMDFSKLRCPTGGHNCNKQYNRERPRMSLNNSNNKLTVVAGKKRRPTKKKVEVGDSQNSDLASVYS